MPLTEKEKKTVLDIARKAEDGYRKWGDKPKRRKLRPGAKFDFTFIELSERLTAAGFADKDLAFAFDVPVSTLRSWKKQFPQFKASCRAGKQMAAKRLVAESMRAATGYYYDKTIITYDASGKKKGKKVITDLVKGDGQLAMFMLANLMPENFKHKREIQLNEDKTVTLKLDGNIDSEQIAKFAGRLFALHSQSDTRKHIISAEVVPDDSKRCGDAKSLPSDVSDKTADSVQDNTVDVRPKTEARV
ncbi:hypothetical protein LCGC14_2057620 [marine sediment metagenome]|uniref:Uncharacterized protein n=1 Tax=marine sediment metagenome TaxID=412755 RepID=A0A0F9H0L3_9ZZZZ